MDAQSVLWRKKLVFRLFVQESVHDEGAVLRLCQRGWGGVDALAAPDENSARFDHEFAGIDLALYVSCVHDFERVAQNISFDSTADHNFVGLDISVHTARRPDGDKPFGVHHAFEAAVDVQFSDDVQFAFADGSVCDDGGVGTIGLGDRHSLCCSSIFIKESH